MSRNFTLVIGALRIPVKIGKATDQKMGLKRGTTDEDGDLVQVKMVNVITKTGGAASSKKDIEKVVPFSRTISMFEVEKGKFVEVDRKAVKAAVAKSTRDIDCTAVYSKDLITFDMLEGSHYFINLSKDKKTKKVTDDQCIIYSIIYNYLNDNKRIIIADFCMTDLKKYVVIYPDEAFECLKMSTLIFNDLQRSSDGDLLVSSKKYKPFKGAMENILDGLLHSEIDYSDFNDEYSAKLKDVIEQTAAGKKVKIPKDPKPDSTTGLLLQLQKIEAIKKKERK